LKDSVSTLVKMVAQVPSAHSYSLLACHRHQIFNCSRKAAGRRIALRREKGRSFRPQEKALAPVVSTSGFAMPVLNALLIAAALSLRAAQQAV
jgi:hypothetical protein